MNAPIIAGWVVSCAAAYFIGSRGNSSSAPSIDSKEQENRTIVRTSDRDSLSGNSRISKSSSQAERDRLFQSSSANDQILEVFEISDPIERSRALLALVEGLSPDEFEETIAGFRSMGITREHMGEYAILLTAWAKNDPLAALEYAQENTGTPFARQTILKSWAKEQPDAAIAWALDHFDGEEDQANPWLVGVIQGITEIDVTRASALLEQLPYSRERGDALGAVLSKMQTQGNEAAQAWVENLTDEQLQDGAAARLAENLGKTNPAEALAWVSSVSEEALARASEDIVAQWAEEDLGAAQNWVEQQPESVQGPAAEGFISVLAENDPSAASEWLRPHAGNPAYDGAVRSLAYRAVESDPVLSAGWILNLTNERDRSRTFHRTIREMMAVDSSAVLNFVQNNEVPGGIQERAERYASEGNR